MYKSGEGYGKPRHSARNAHRRLAQKSKGENTMSTNEMTSKVEQLRAMEAIIADMTKAADAIRDEIKAEMTRRGAEEMEVGRYIIRWTPVLTQRFDTSAFKRTLPEIYKAYLKQSASRRFAIV